MTLPNGSAGVAGQSLRFGVGPGGADNTSFDGRSEDAIKSILSSQQKPGIDNAFGDFNGGLVGMLIRVFTGAGGGILASGLQYLAGLFNLRWDQVDRSEQAAADAKTQAQGALDAATAADNKVTSLIQGGVRTIFTSNTTYIPGPDVFRIVVLLYGGGANGSDAAFSSPGGLPGGVITADIPRSGFPTDGFFIVIGASGQPTTCGPFSSANNGGGGQITNSTLIALASSVFPGAGGRSGVGVANGGNGTAGGSTSLAAGGDGAGGVGGNAAVDGQYLAGGGGGGGGISSSNQFGPATNGGAGGFPGGGGGGAGRNGNEAYWVGGIGAPGLCAIIEYKAET